MIKRVITEGRRMDVDSKESQKEREWMMDATLLFCQYEHLVVSNRTFLTHS